LKLFKESRVVLVPLPQRGDLVSNRFESVALNRSMDHTDDVAVLEVLGINGLEKRRVAVGDDESRWTDLSVTFTGARVKKGCA